MNTLTDLLIITCLICFITDVSGFVQSIKRQYLRKFWGIKNPDISVLNWKPFDCSLCLTFYSTLIYIAVTGNFTLPWIGMCVLLSLISSNISGFMLCVKDFLAAVECRIQKLIEKI